MSLRCCSRCGGSGAEPSAKTLEPFNRCKDCDGRGVVWVITR